MVPCDSSSESAQQSLNIGSKMKFDGQPPSEWGVKMFPRKKICSKFFKIFLWIEDTKEIPKFVF